MPSPLRIINPKLKNQTMGSRGENVVVITEKMRLCHSIGSKYLMNEVLIQNYKLTHKIHRVNTMNKMASFQ
jgi:hypothetical protein